MSNRLFLHPRQTPPSSDWPCALLIRGAWQRTELSDAARQLLGEPVCVVLPVELFSCWSTGPWPRRPSIHALGYAIEEQLSAPLDTLHLAAGPMESDRRCALRACDNELFAQIMAVLDASGIQADALHIDADLLPGEQPAALWLFDRWLLGGQGAARLALSAQDVEGDGAWLMKDRVRLGEPYSQASLDRLVPTRATPNLLPSPPLRWPGKVVAAVVLTLIAIECSLNWASAWHQHRVAQVLEARTTSYLNTLLPPTQQGGSALAQLQALHSSAAPPGEPLIAERLSHLAQALVGAQGVTLQRIERQSGTWTLRLSAPAIIDIERLRERATEHQLPLQLLSATQEAGRTVAVMSLEDAL